MYNIIVKSLTKEVEDWTKEIVFLHNQQTTKIVLFT